MASGSSSVFISTPLRCAVTGAVPASHHQTSGGGGLPSPGHGVRITALSITIAIVVIVCPDELGVKQGFRVLDRLRLHSEGTGHGVTVCFAPLPPSPRSPG